MFLIKREKRFPSCHVYIGLLSARAFFAVLQRQVRFTRPFKSFSHLLLSWAAILLLQFVLVIKYLKPFLFSPLFFSPHLGARHETARSTNRVSAPPGLVHVDYAGTQTLHVQV